MNSLITYCTRCKKTLSDLKFNVSFKFEAYREKESGAWESLENLDITSHEILCEDCFNLLSSKIKEMNNV